jgi:hypothetical protein
MGTIMARVTDEVYADYPAAIAHFQQAMRSASFRNLESAHSAGGMSNPGQGKGRGKKEDMVVLSTIS